MMNHVLRLAAMDSHVHRIDDEFGTHVRCHRPADDATNEDVEYDGKEGETTRLRSQP